MVAIVGIPGSQYHAYGHFTKRAVALQWAHATRDQILKRNRAVASLPVRVISDREADKVRYQDGERVYDAGR